MLADGPDPRASREKQFSVFLKDEAFVLRNPPLGGEIRQPVWSIARGGVMQIRSGDTRQGGGASRAVDLGCGSSELGVRMLIHNGLHCKLSCACLWDRCMDALWSDHFLCELQVAPAKVDNNLPRPTDVWLPDEVHAPGRWPASFLHVRQALHQVSCEAHTWKSLGFKRDRGNGVCQPAHGSWTHCAGFRLC